MSKAPVKLVYILGHGHSGSTLLSLILGAHPRIENLGEVEQMALRDRPARCSCRVRPFSDCALWRARVEAFERDEAPARFAGRDVASPDPATFARANLGILRAARAHSGAEWLVDASKSLVRLERLRAIGPEALEIRVVHLLREAPGVVNSYVKKESGSGAFQESVRYARTALSLGWFLGGCGHVDVAYHEVVSDPQAVTQRILAGTGLGWDPVQADWGKAESHSVGGNNMRFRQRDRLALDRSWRSELKPHQRLAAALIARPGSALAGAVERVRGGLSRG